MVKSNIEPIIEDMDLHDSLEAMVKDAIEQGLIEQTGYNDDGEPTFGITYSGRKMMEESDVWQHIKHEIDKVKDAHLDS